MTPADFSKAEGEHRAVVTCQLEGKDGTHRDKKSRVKQKQKQILLILLELQRNIGKDGNHWIGLELYVVTSDRTSGTG